MKKINFLSAFVVFFLFFFWFLPAQASNQRIREQVNQNVSSTSVETGVTTNREAGNGLGREIVVEDDSVDGPENPSDEINLISPQPSNLEVNSGSAFQRRSQVAEAVQVMLQVRSQDENVGEQIREIAQNQIKNQEKIEQSLEKIKSRNKVVNFLVGTNNREVNKAKVLLKENMDKLTELENIKTMVEAGDQDIIDEQIEKIKQVSQEVELNIENSKKKFSLFGFVSRFFSK
ncbi:MAG: hypothetical protein WC928_03300 [Patescibacteria group bacterium]|jgi:hypothetical protein